MTSKQVHAVLVQTSNLNEKHYATLIGERPFGSKWGKEITRDELVSLPWQEVKAEGPNMLPFCTYFRATLPEGYGAMQNAEPFTSIPNEHIQVQEGAHGLELVSDLVNERECSEAWLIVGPAQDEKGNKIEGQYMVWTAFPGELLSPLPKGFDGNIDSLDSQTDYAVKGK